MISVIIPAYNCEQWLGEAVASVIAQSDRDWELLLLDDGSTDGTGALCDRLGESDRRIRVLHIPNGGVSMARNRGIRAAHGEWITFLDADDILHPEAFATLLRLADKHHADIVSGDLVEFEGESSPFRGVKTADCAEHLLTASEAVEQALYQRGWLTASCSCKLYARGLWDSVEFTPGIRYEDLDIICRLWMQSKCIAHVSAPLYAYRQHPASFMHRFTEVRTDVLDVTENMERWVSLNAPQLLPAVRDRRMSAAFNMFLLAERARRGGKMSAGAASRIQTRCWEQIRRLRRASLTNDKVRLRNRLGALVSYLGPGILRQLYPLL